MSTTFDPDRLSALVIDQSPHHRALIAALLRGHGVSKIRSAETAAEGLEILRRNDPSVVFTEWEADGVDGLALCREIRMSADIPNRAVPVVVITARAARVDVEAARNAGVNEYVIKPVSAQSVLSRLQEVILRPRQFIESPNYVGPCRRRRKMAAYAGPFRRMSDPIDDVTALDPGEARKKELARRGVAALQISAQGLAPGDRARLRRVYSAATELASCGREIADPTLERCAQSLLRYLDGVGASPRLDAQVVETHVEAINRILELPNAARELREKVASGLSLMVSKKLRGEAGVEDFDQIMQDAASEAPAVTKIATARP